MGIIIFWFVFCLIGVFIALFLLRRIYGKDIKKWEPIICTKDLTIGSIFSPKRKDKRSMLSQKKDNEEN